MSGSIFAAAIALATLALTICASSGCAQRIKGRELRFHSPKDVTTPPEKQEAGRAVTDPSRRASNARPKGYQKGHRPLDSDRTGTEAYRVFLQRAEMERRRRYGPPPPKKKPKKKGSKKSAPKALPASRPAP